MGYNVISVRSIAENSVGLATADHGCLRVFDTRGQCLSSYCGNNTDEKELPRANLIQLQSKEDFDNKVWDMYRRYV